MKRNTYHATDYYGDRPCIKPEFYMNFWKKRTKLVDRLNKLADFLQIATIIVAGAICTHLIYLIVK